MPTHGRHRRQRTPVPAATTGRVAVSVATLGLGALQLGGVAAAAPAHTVDGTSCTDARIKACVDLSENTTWLLDGEGNVVYGAVPNSHGSEGHETPTGDFVVQWKDRDHKSKEYGGASMPYAVFFDTHGRAFHQGSRERQSAGCVRLDEDDAKRFFDHLEPNDRVQIVP
jgi:lipoprotein-anchoring transpeptidase ErfK/SrfK